MAWNSFKVQNTTSTQRGASPLVCPVQPEAFVTAMNARWRQLGNQPSAPLMEIWRITAATYSDAITKRDHVWKVLQPPTGTGKTQGLCVYAAQTITQNRTSLMPIGILVVTRLIQQANEIVEAIRSLTPDDAAHRVQTSHTEDPLSKGAMEAADVLIVTHSAYVLALQARQAQEFGRLADYMNWAHGPRLLTIIDEPLTGLIEQNQVKAQDVAIVLACMDGDLCWEFSNEFKTLWHLHNILQCLDKAAAKARAGKLGPVRKEILWPTDDDGRVTFSRECSMVALRKAMSKLPSHRMLHGTSVGDDLKPMRERVDRTLRECEAITGRWCFSYQKGLDATLNSGQLLIPPDLPGPVVLDATATQNFLWKLMGARALLVPIPKGARSYSNVNLHVARVACGLGKGLMQDKAKTRVPQLFANLKKVLSPDGRVLVCLHQVAKDFARAQAVNFARFSFAHYGALDGRNDWQDHASVVIFGMNYRDDVWTTIMFFALKGLQSDEWLKTPTWAEYENVHREMQRGHLITVIIQAINRVRCRRVIDADGNCPPTDIFILLDDGAEGSAILDAILMEMPGIVVEPWDFVLDAPQGRVRGATQQAVVKFMRECEPGETKTLLLKEKLGMNNSVYKDLMNVLRDKAHPFHSALAEIGASFVPPGRGSRAVLVKR